VTATAQSPKVLLLVVAVLVMAGLTGAAPTADRRSGDREQAGRVVPARGAPGHQAAPTGRAPGERVADQRGPTDGAAEVRVPVTGALPAQVPGDLLAPDAPAGPDPAWVPVADLAGGAGPPSRVRIPAIGVDTPLERLTLDGQGQLLAPREFARAGWYAEGTVPGRPGPAVIGGHVDSVRGPAVFHRLRDLHDGDLVEVERDGRWVRFAVTGSTWYPKRAFPAERVYAPTPDPQLRLITCGGDFDRSRRSYVDNLVVSAVAIDAGGS